MGEQKQKPKQQYVCTFKLSEAFYQRLTELGRESNLSPHAVARQIVATAISTSGSSGSGASEVEGDRASAATASPAAVYTTDLLSLQADVEHLIVEVSRLTSFVQKLAQFQAMLGELLLINIGHTDETETAQTITNLLEAVFTDE